MAKLLKTPAPGNWKIDFDNFKTSLKKQEASLKALGNKVIEFPVADDAARYYVKSMKPLVLQHIPYMDGYRVNPVLIRGLRADDVTRMLIWKKDIQKLFAKKGK